MFLVNAKRTEAMEAVIQCIQAIKQASLPDSPVSHHPSSCQPDIPHLAVTNEAFYTWGQRKCYVDSRPYFSFRGMLYPSKLVGPPPPVRCVSIEMGQGNEEVDFHHYVLMNRKRRKDDIDIHQAPCFTPYYPDVFPSQPWAMLILVSQAEVVPLFHFRAAASKSNLDSANYHHRYPRLGLRPRTSPVQSQSNRAKHTRCFQSQVSCHE